MLLWNVWSIANEEKLPNFTQILQNKDINMFNGNMVRPEDRNFFKKIEGRWF